MRTSLVVPLGSRRLALLGAMAGLLPVGLGFSGYGQSGPLTDVGSVTAVIVANSAFSASPTGVPELRDRDDLPLGFSVFDTVAPVPSPISNPRDSIYGVGAGGGHTDSVSTQTLPDVGRQGDGKSDAAQGGVTWSMVDGVAGDRFDVLFEAQTSAQDAYLHGTWTGNYLNDELTLVSTDGISRHPADASTTLEFRLQFTVPLGGTATLVTPDLSGLVGELALHETETLLSTLGDVTLSPGSGTGLVPQLELPRGLTWGPGDRSETVLLEGGRSYEYALVYTAQVPFGVDPQFGLNGFVDLVFTPQSGEVPEPGTVQGGLAVAAVVVGGGWRRRLLRRA